MKKQFTRLLALSLSLILSLGLLPTHLSASAANYTTNYSQYSTPSSSDYAYWNGYRVVRASKTTTSEIKWMQAALNYCIKNEGLDASYLDVDGSFGPASKAATLKFQKAANLTQDGSFGPGTIAKMKSVLADGKATFKSTSTTATTFNLVWPTSTKTITGKYGTNGSLRSNGTRYHSGIDIGSSVGDPCYAAADGVVVMCKSSDDSRSTIGGRGRYIVIYHANGNFSTLYEHLDSCSVNVGDTVKAGQKIGTTGRSGWQSSGVHYAAHLHFGVMEGKMTNTGYDLWTVPGKTYGGVTYTNHTIDPDPRYNGNVKYTYK